MDDQERKKLALEYARLAVQAKRQKIKLPTDPMKAISAKLGTSHVDIIHEAVRHVKYNG